MYTLEKSTPTREPPDTKLQIEMKIVFMKMLLKMNYVFSTPNSKNVWVNYGLSRTLLVLKSNKIKLHAHKSEVER